MQIGTMFAQKECVFSIEVFPPKKQGSTPQALFPVLDRLGTLSPDFISVTYGAGGSAADRATCEIASYIKNKLTIETLAHLTCVNLDAAQADAIVKDLAENRIENVLVLRGDLPQGMPACGTFAHASDLAAHLLQKSQFSLSGACYPEGHVESENLRRDVENLRFKLENGVSHLITQLFFDNGCYYRFLNLARKAGYTVPVQAGVMPIVNARQIQRVVALSSASLPGQFTKMISKYDSDPAALFDAGIDYAIQQIRDLIEGGADGIHLYAMNQPDVAQRVYDGIRDLLPKPCK